MKRFHCPVEASHRCVMLSISCPYVLTFNDALGNMSLPEGSAWASTSFFVPSVRQWPQETIPPFFRAQYLKEKEKTSQLKMAKGKILSCLVKGIIKDSQPWHDTYVPVTMSKTTGNRILGTPRAYGPCRPDSKIVLRTTTTPWRLW